MLKKIPIKTRIVLWFGSFMLILLFLMFVFYFFFSRHLVNSDNKGRLIRVVDLFAVSLSEEYHYTLNGANLEESEEENEDQDEKVHDKIEIEKFINGYEGIYIATFKPDGTVMEGNFPDDFTNALVKFDDQEIQIQEIHGVNWWVYDRKMQNSEGNDIWVRGISTNARTESTSNLLFLLLIAGLPLLVIWAALGGYFMLKKAFVPINQIIKTAEEIGEGKDLTRRLHMGDGKDEIYKLANTFDRMFERLEAYFDNEKRFTSDASHELRTPVAVIISQCEYAIENNHTLGEDKQSFEQILAQAKKMSMLISELLLLARADNGTQKLYTEKINISELLEIICEQQSEVAAEKQIELIADIQPNIIIEGDETLLLRMMINLIENGICYGKVSGYLKVLLTEEEKNINLKIIDNGIGIEPEHLDKIWERFFQVDASRNSKNDNSGLGLSMVKWIVNAHGGSIQVESQFQEGSTFHIQLPKVQQQ